jgi:hypothetical protein
LVAFDPPIYSSDVLLTIDYQGLILKEIWNHYQETYYFNNGTLDFGYRFDYTNRDVDIYMVGNDFHLRTQAHRSFEQIVPQVTPSQ